MKSVASVLASVVVGLVLATGLGLAHHPISAKFDDTQAADPQRNRHVARLEKPPRPCVHECSRDERNRELGRGAGESHRAAAERLESANRCNPGMRSPWKGLPLATEAIKCGPDRLS